MAFFKFSKYNYSKPGPGVNKDEPRKRGVQRFLEVLGRDFGALVKLNLLFCVCALPSAALFYLGLFVFKSVLILLLSLVAAFPVGGALTACMFFVTMRLRDDPGYVWDDFKRKFLENFKRTMILGILCAAFVYIQVYLWGSWLIGGVTVGLVEVISALLSLLIFGMVTPYLYVQAGYLDLRALQLVKNSLLLAFAHALRSLLGSLAGGAIWVVFALFLPTSLVTAPLILLFGFSLSWLLTLMCVWPPVDKQFAIEETLHKRYDENSKDFN